MSALEVVQNVNSSRSNALISFFIFKYCQLQSFYDLFEIDKIFFDEFNDLVRNIMISDFEH